MLTTAAITRRRVWLVAVTLPVALLTASAAPFRWALVVFYCALAFVLNLFVRPRNEDRLTLIHVLVLCGTAPVVMRLLFGNQLGVLGTVHVCAVLVLSIGIGYLLAEFVRARQTLPDRHAG